jgi:hypothetical protein
MLWISDRAIRPDPDGDKQLADEKPNQPNAPSRLEEDCAPNGKQPEIRPRKETIAVLHL